MSPPAAAEPRMRDRVFVVTGANSGIGLETSRGLARMGATVVMACRSRERGEQARAEVATTATGSPPELWLVDLARQDEIRRFAKDLIGAHPRIHVLVNNAGLHTAHRSLTPDGLETTFAVNHLAPFLVTYLLRDALAAAAPSRVVTVASEAHRYAKADLDDPQGQKRWSGTRAYCDSKLWNIMFTYALARRLSGTGVTANCLHPGTVRTGWARRGESGALGLLVRVATPFLVSPRKGALTSLHVASSPGLATTTGGYFVRSKATRSSRVSRDEQVQERLWALSEGLTGVRWPAPASRP